MNATRTATDGRLYARFELVTDHVPTADDVVRAQTALGYSPAGYGSPWQVKTTAVGTGFVTTWACSGSCD